MKSKVYIETTIVSYVTARSSRDLIIAAHQQITQEWWNDRRVEFELYISQLVIQEAAAGDIEGARKRLEILNVFPLLELKPESLLLARALLDKGSLPAKAAEDALHIAVATVHGMDYLLTWNCKHIANAATRNRIEAICREEGYEPPVICTPEELLGD